jgi:hypothetical protein
VLGEPTRAAEIMIREPVRTAEKVIGEPIRTTRTSERVIVPTVEKGIQQIEAKKKGKRHAWQPWYEITSCLVVTEKVMKGQFGWFVGNMVYVGCVMKEQFVWFVWNLLKHLVVFWGWLVCWKYCCLCMLMNVDVVFV